MKKYILATVLTLGMTSTAFANKCGYSSDEGWIALLMLSSIVSAPTGMTILVSGGNCRDEILNLREDAFKYKMTGEMSEVLKANIESGKKAKPDLTEEQLVNKFMSMQVED
ncbi:MAG: hypothetical protein J7501_02405 [Bdellovibrio sp.]|nr:hypothetical protein [Bdellovibrio sp.]